MLTYRSIRESWVWKKKPFSTGQAWLDLIMDANHDVGKFYLNGKLKTIGRGQTWTSVRTLAERWGWRNEGVLDFLKALEEDGMIRRFSTPSGTLITVVNYSKYQGFRDFLAISRNTQRNDRGNDRRNDRGNDRRNKTKKDQIMIEEGEKKGALPPEEKNQNPEDDLSAWEALEDDDAIGH